jgi:hypothetical protein
MSANSPRARTARRAFIPIILTITAPASSGCDLCSTPTAPDNGSGASVGLFEQYSHFGTLRDNGEQVPNPVGQFMDSSVTQLVFGYRFSGITSAQLVVPYIHRTFKRPEGFSIDTGTEQGLGDISLLGALRILSVGGEDSILRIDEIAGIKAPTGNSDRLAEEANEVVVPGAPPSGVHGHDLTEGSGSWDVPLGLDVVGRDRRWYLGAHAQYTIRTRGSHDYQFANDFTWNITPGYDVWRSGTDRLGVEANLSGEAKGKDVANGEVQDDTGIVAMYLGPQLTAAFRRHAYACAGVDLPLFQHATSLQLVPDYRIHGGLVWAF